jgi:[ribosomal protein S18]-alanine N-acetyltransferase
MSQFIHKLPAELRHILSDYNDQVEFTLRDYRAADFEILWSIDQRCFPPGIAYSRRELGIYIGHPRSFTLVAEASAHNSQDPPPEEMRPGDRGIVGFLVAESGRRVGHIITIDVLPIARRSGVGSKLMLAAEERLRAGSCRSVYLETAADNVSALAFYKRHEYFLVKTVPGYYSNGMDALVLQKELLSQAQAG